ncbi:hypothetical protein TNCV_1499541 [Trichonephila clavipes]|nr:hypothetical protein TNCV_1499541 [Trichonephila clavipes]
MGWITCPHRIVDCQHSGGWQRSRRDLPYGGLLEPPHDSQRQPGQQVHQCTAQPEKPPARICDPQMPIFLRQGQVFSPGPRKKRSHRCQGMGPA